MSRYFEYLDDKLYCHHSLDIAPAASNFHMHAHERMEMYYFIRGDVSYIIEGHYYELTPGTIMIVRSAEAHNLLFHSQIPYERISICFDPSVLAGVDPDKILLRPYLERPLGHLNCYKADKPLQQLILTYFPSIDDSCSQARRRTHVLALLYMILIQVSNQFEALGDISFDSFFNSTSSRLVHYINAHLYEDISLETISQNFFLSQSQLNRIFRKATGSSIWEYIRTKRLLAAREKILAGEKVSDASLSCGFQDYSTFFRAYRDYFGMVPSATPNIEKHKDYIPANPE